MIVVIKSIPRGVKICICKLKHNHFLVSAVSKLIVVISYVDSNFLNELYKENFHNDKDDISPRVHRDQDWNTCRYISLSVNSFQMEEVGLIRHMVYFVLSIIVISCINSKFLTKFYFLYR